MPCVSDEASVTRGWRERSVSCVREKATIRFGLGTNRVRLRPKRHAPVSRVFVVRDARPSRTSSIARTHHSRESVRQPLEVVSRASRELARLQPRGPRFFVSLREDAGVRFHPGDFRGPGNARLTALGHDVRRDGLHRADSTHAPLERDTRRTRRDVAWSLRTRGRLFSNANTCSRRVHEKEKLFGKTQKSEKCTRVSESSADSLRARPRPSSPVERYVHARERVVQARARQPRRASRAPLALSPSFASASRATRTARDGHVASNKRRVTAETESRRAFRGPSDAASRGVVGSGHAVRVRACRHTPRHARVARARHV